MKTEEIIDKDALIRQLEDQFWDERENHKAHAKILFKENAALKSALLIAREYMLQFKGRGAIGEIDKDLAKINNALKI